MDLFSDDGVWLEELSGELKKKIFSKWWFWIRLMMSCAKTMEQLCPDFKRQKLDEKPIIVH